MEPCHECGAPADEACERCKRPTCPNSYYEREHLGLCQCCHDELAAEMATSGFELGEWPYPLRKPFGA